jgi:hypothetical protein
MTKAVAPPHTTNPGASLTGADLRVDDGGRRQCVWPATGEDELASREREPGMSARTAVSVSAIGAVNGPHGAAAGRQPVGSLMTVGVQWAPPSVVR